MIRLKSLICEQSFSTARDDLDDVLIKLQNEQRDVPESMINKYR